jgi:Fe-S cluster assembly ATP-binding protein
MTPSTPAAGARPARRCGRTHVLRSVHAGCAAGALVVLMGANGSGKSTLGLALAGHPRYRVARPGALLGGTDLLGDERA